ncbi:MAG: sigma-70 family RNA polymerase sigma factor [Bryobacterales bacterium]|nr:sigma-70 family RNA polymerase sigma factor [Bryobacterales bacterium]
MTRQDDISGLLMAWCKGDENALGDVMPLVYRDLRGIARNQLRRRGAGLVMHSGTLAHEAYLRLVRARGIRCGSRAHFFALCSQMIRRILVDEARKQSYAKRGGGQVRVSLQEALLGTRAEGVDVEALNGALTALAKQDARKARVVELRFFGGLSVEETAEVLEISEETVTRDWRMAKMWLFRELGGGKSGGWK